MREQGGASDGRWCAGRGAARMQRIVCVAPEASAHATTSGLLAVWRARSLPVAFP